MIVPRSTQLVSQDNDYGLFTVTLFKKVAEEFKHHAREKKYDVLAFDNYYSFYILYKFISILVMKFSLFCQTQFIYFLFIL